MDETTIATAPTHQVRDELIVTVLSTIAGMATTVLFETVLKKARLRRNRKNVPATPPTE